MLNRTAQSWQHGRAHRLGSTLFLQSSVLHVETVLLSTTIYSNECSDHILILVMIMKNSEVPRLRWPLNTQAILGPGSYTVIHSVLFVCPASVHKDLNYCQLEGLVWLESTGEQSIKFSIADPY